MSEIALSVWILYIGAASCLVVDKYAYAFSASNFFMKSTSFFTPSTGMAL